MHVTLDDTYTIPQEHLDFCATIKQIAQEKIAPRSAEIDEQAEYPWDIRKVLAEQDILGLPFPVEYGGTGTGTLMLNMGVEEIAPHLQEFQTVGHLYRSIAAGFRHLADTGRYGFLTIAGECRKNVSTSPW